MTAPLDSHLAPGVTRRLFLGGLFGITILAREVQDAKAATYTASAQLQELPEPGKAVIALKANQASKVYLEYGFSSSALSLKTSIVALKAGATRTLTLTKLGAGTEVFYRLRYLKPGSKKYLAKPVAAFFTASKFEKATFAVQADPHMDDNSSSDVYKGTLAQISKSAPAFLVDLGDIFMVDKLAEKSEKNIRARFELMKGFYKRLGNVPLKIVLGNHDGELGYSAFNTKKYRAEYFPEQTGEVAYFAFEGPDQLHICLDPFTYTTQSPKSDGWQWTLGETQYNWLREVLEKSTATHKFVYIHHLLVGDAQSRGGVEIAAKNEWGGQNNDGSDGFAANRPGWYKPIHHLLVENKVSFVFKGHDHIYVHQELDGITYQTLPQPSHPGEKVNPAQYGYLSGKAVGGSGFLRISTSARVARVEFVTFEGKIADSYERQAH